MNIVWDPERTGRLDDGSDPHFCHYRAAVRVEHAGGRVVESAATARLDLRDGARHELTPEQLATLRADIVGYCERKARRRALRQAGVKA